MEPYWPKLFANLCAGRDIGDLLTSGGGSAAPAPAAAAPAAGGAAAPAAKKEEPKEEEEAGEYVKWACVVLDVLLCPFLLLYYHEHPSCPCARFCFGVLSRGLSYSFDGVYGWCVFVQQHGLRLVRLNTLVPDPGDTSACCRVVRYSGMARKHICHSVGGAGARVAAAFTELWCGKMRRRD